MTYWRPPKEWDKQARKAFAEANRRYDKEQRMKMGQFFEGESQFLKAADLQGREVRVTICEVGSQEFDKDGGGTEIRPFIRFRGKEKGVVLNKTNGHRLIDAFGEDSDDWLEKEIYLYSERVEYKGKPVDGIRLRVPKPAADDSEVPF